MSSSFSTRLDLLLKTLFAAVIVPELHIVSMEYSVLREKGQPLLLSVEILFCEAEQKKDYRLELVKKVVEN